MTFKQQQIVTLGLIAIGLFVATTAIVKADERTDKKPAIEAIAFCQQYKTEAEKQAGLMRREEYKTAKQMFSACLNAAHWNKLNPKQPRDIGYYMDIHEQNETDQEQMIDKYKSNH